MKLEGLKGQERLNWFRAVNKQIEKIIGEEPEAVDQKIAYTSARRELQQLAQKYGDEVLTGQLLNYGRWAEGYTPSGKRVHFELNRGATKRTFYCGTLKIDGKTIFTSGRIGKCFEYIFNN